MKPITPKSQSHLLLYVALLLLAIWAMFGIRICSTESPLGEEAQRPSGGDTIDVAIEYSPLSLYMYNDTLGGFNYDLLRQMSALFGLHLKFHPVSSYGTALKGLDNELYDVVVADIPVTSDSTSRYLLTEPSFLARQVLLQRKNDDGQFPVNGQLDLAGKTVHVAKSSPALLRLKNLSAEIGDTIYVVEDSIYGSEQLLMLTAAGEIELSVVNEHIARSLASQYPNLDITTQVSFTQFQSWILRHDDHGLKQLLDEKLKQFKATDSYKALTERYFQ